MEDPRPTAASLAEPSLRVRRGPRTSRQRPLPSRGRAGRGCGGCCSAKRVELTPGTTFTRRESRPATPGLLSASPDRQRTRAEHEAGQGLL